MPAPRRNARRERAVRVEINGPVLDGVVLMADYLILAINRQLSRGFGGEFFDSEESGTAPKNFRVKIPLQDRKEIIGNCGNYGGF